MKKKTSPVFWIALVGVAAAIFVLTEPEKKKATVKPKTNTVVVKRGQSTFLEEDYDATFSPVNQPPRNAFMPLVVRNEGASMPNVLPSALVGGANWTYTGTAEVDGVPMALLENSATGESVFLKHGENWKGLTVTSIAPETVVFSGGMGVTYTLRLLSNQPTPLEAEVGTMPAQIGNAPQISGQIGQNLTAVPENSPPPPPAAAPIAIESDGGGPRANENRRPSGERRQNQVEKPSTTATAEKPLAAVPEKTEVINK